jgi:hypothetical protein
MKATEGMREGRKRERDVGQGGRRKVARDGCTGGRMWGGRERPGGVGKKRGSDRAYESREWSRRKSRRGWEGQER